MKTAMSMLALLLLPAGCQPDATAGVDVDPATSTSGPEAAAGLPLDHGYYVRTDETCADASGAGLHQVNRTGLRWVSSFCVFDRIERTGDTTWRVQQSCGDHGGAGQDVAEYEIPDRTSFSFRSGSGWEHAARLCPQGELPEPWRSADPGGSAG